MSEAPTQAEQPIKKKRGRVWRVVGAIVALLFVLAIAAGVAAWWLLYKVENPVAAGAPVTVVVKKGSSAKIIAEQLAKDGVVANAGPGHRNEVQHMEWLASLGADCDQWGMVLVAEMKPGGFDSGPEFQTLDNHMLAARLGSEYGADLIKMPHCDGFEAVVAGCYTPIVVLGGSKMSEEQLIAMVYGAMQAGAVGCAVGRNIWGAAAPTKMTAALAAVIHGNASIAEAMKLLG